MLQDVLTQKQVELFQSPSVVRLLKRYQNKKLLARNSHASTDTYSSESNQSQQNAASEQKLHTEREEELEKSDKTQLKPRFYLQGLKEMIEQEMFQDSSKACEIKDNLKKISSTTAENNKKRKKEHRKM
ncbi:Hypothetical predicted protein [Paramuricea clavata]|uniref:Uncharacterized protein n=1 Tax=Paramuricea clavata TaxID=317549 RepID=A0A6S7IE04_PARCT|nr:Hypothetical predicted protein [Paramuricea clavata]